MLLDELLWIAVVHSATVHPLQSSKQAKVTSGQLGVYILWLVVYMVWQWNQRVVDAVSKNGISSSYFMRVCVLVWVCAHTSIWCACTWMSYMHVHLTAMWLIMNSEQEMKALFLGTCSAHAWYNSHFLLAILVDGSK